MSAFLWVEDFEGSQFREFAYAIFGSLLKLESSEFPNSENELRKFLRQHRIYLVTNFADAHRFISTKIGTVDSVVLDIDLNLLGEEPDEDRPIVIPVLQRWYEYDPTMPDSAAEEASFNLARDKMKMIAGYHLYTDLVLDKNFSRERILFCSNHGNYLDAMNESFGKARIETPTIFRKADAQVGAWTVGQCEDKYIWLRRWVTIACQTMQDRLHRKNTRFLLPNLPGVQLGSLSNEDAEILLETLPMLLPNDGRNKSQRNMAFRIFVRTLTQDWDKIDFKTSSFEQPDKSFAAVLKTARNWASHDSKAFSEIEEGDIAFLFLIAMRMSFSLPIDKLENFEFALIPMIGPRTALNTDRLVSFYEETFSTAKLQFKTIPNVEPTRFYDDMVNNLQRNGLLQKEQQLRYLRNIYWHQMHWSNDRGEWSPNLRNYSKYPFLRDLSEHLLSVSG